MSAGNGLAPVLARTVATGTFAIAAILLAAGPADAQGANTASCGTTVGDAVALQLDGNVPIVAGRDGAIARFAATLQPSGALAVPSQPPHIWCSGIHGVVGIAVAANGTLFVADATTVHRFEHGRQTGAFAPSLATGESIAAIALLPSGATELVLATRAAAAVPTATGPAPAARFAIYGPATRGEAAAPVREFRYAAFLGAVSAITIDSQGRTYAYDDGGEILVFPAGSTGAATPARRLYGSSTPLRPIVRGAVHGSRQLALDLLGYLYAADDGSIARFTFYSDDPNTVTSDVIAIDPGAKLGLVRGLATDGTNAYALSVDPATRAAALVVFSPYAASGTPIRIAVP